MIITYATIGKILMQQTRFKEMSENEQKRYILLQFCYDLDNYHWKDKQQVDYYGRLLELQLDLETGTCKFVQGTQLLEDKSQELMIFSNYAPNDPNIYGTHTSIKTVLGFELLQFVEKNAKEIHWSHPESLDDFISFLQKIQDKFYLSSEPGLRLNYELLDESQQEGFPDPAIDEVLASNILNKKEYKKLFTKKISEYLNTTLKDLVTERQAYALRINGQLLHKSEFSEFYTDILYHYIFGKQFHGSAHQGNCHLCSQYTSLAEEVALKQKFYGTTNPLYFDNLNSSLSKYAFSMCQQCYEEIIVGTQFAATKLKTYLLGMNAIALPEIPFIPAEPTDLIEPESLDSLVNLLRHLTPAKRVNSLKVIRTLQDKLHDFSLLFYYKPSATSQQFNINGLIRSINIENLLSKTEDLDELAFHYHLGTILGIQGDLSFESLRYLVLPSRDSHPQLKSSEYYRINRSIIQMLSTYLHDQKFYFKQLVSQFIDMFSRKSSHLKASDSNYALNLSPFLMSIYLNHLIKYQQLEGVPKMDERQMTTQLIDENILQYFLNNEAVYAGNYQAQGLFILGMYIANVESEQRRKKISTTLINRLNLRGIPVTKVKSVLALVDDMRQIWKTYNDPITDAYFRECLNGIETSIMMPEEVVFHILSGRAYSGFLSITYKKNHENNPETNQEVQND